MRPSTQEEEDIDVIRSWMEVGGHPARPDEEAKGLLLEVNAFLCFFFFFTLLSLPLICLFATNSSLTILMFRLLLAISSFFVGFETAPASECKKRRGQKARNRGSKFRDSGVG